MPAETKPRTTQEALEAVDARFGGLDELAITMIDRCPDYLEGEIGLAEAATRLNVPFIELSAAVSAPDFNKALDRLASYSEYSFGKRRVVMRNLTSIATTMQKTTMSRSGKAVLVDREADEIIKADMHLRKLQGRPVDEPRKDAGIGIQIVFGGTGDADDRTVDVKVVDGEEGDEGGKVKAATPYVPNRAGSLPPADARKHYRGENPSEGRDSDGSLRPELDFTREQTPKKNLHDTVAAAATFGRRHGESGDGES